jgi:hypothetical protein
MLFGPALGGLADRYGRKQYVTTSTHSKTQAEI